MKVEFAQENVKAANGLGDTRGFKIAANAHAFKMLSSGLYSDKVRAVLREIGCNAQDAHIEQGTPDRPIVVKLPNELDTQFYVRDWGPGLSHDAIMNLYSTYFQSTKQNSNDFTGAFGLGSKSPFSYTDSFSVISTHGGRRRTYSIYLDNKGAPTTSLMSEEDPLPDWEHGLQVGFAVKAAHFAEFQQKAQQVFQWFRVKPEIRGAKDIEPLQFKYRCEDYALAVGVSGTHVLMGNVAYPLDLGQLGINQYNSQPKLPDFLGHIASGLVLPVPIGTVQVAASREQLQYDKSSLDALKERAGMVVKRIGKELVHVMEEAEKGGWPELLKARDALDNQLPGLRYSFGNLAKCIGLDPVTAERYGKFIHRSHLAFPDKLQFEKVASRLIVASTKRGGTRNAPTSIVHKGHTHRGAQAYVFIVPNTVIAYGTAPHAVARARRAVLDGIYEQVILFTKSKDRDPTPVQIGEAVRIMSESLGGNVPTIDIAKLDAPVYGSGAPRKKKPKNWVPQLDPLYGCHVMKFGAKDTEQGTLGDVKDQLYMCLVTKSSWHRKTSYYRLFDTTDENDHNMSDDQWMTMWKNYGTLAKALDIKGPQSYAVLSPSECRSQSIKQLGWKWATIGIREYVERKDVREALRKRCTRFKPTVPEYMDYNQGWMSHIANLCTDANYMKALAPILKRRGVCDEIEGVVEETIKRGKRPAKETPPELEAYRWINQVLGISDTDASIKMEESVTLGDMDLAFVRRYPYLESTITASDFADFTRRHGGEAAAKFLEFLTSSEKI